MFCPKCGKEIKDTAKFCNFCGETITKETSSVSAVNNTIQTNPVMVTPDNVHLPSQTLKIKKQQINKVSPLESLARKRMAIFALMNDDGDYNDFRVFEEINILNGTQISSTVNNTESTKMIVDEDGNGKTDFTYVAGKNQMGRKVVTAYAYMISISALALGIVLSLLVLVTTKGKKQKIMKDNG